MTIPERVRLSVRAHRRIFAGVVIAISVFLWGVVGAVAWVAADIVSGLPDGDALRSVGTMAQATTLD